MIHFVVSDLQPEPHNVLKKTPNLLTNRIF